VNTKNVTNLGMIALASLLIVGVAHASPSGSLPACSASNVWASSITPFGGGANVLSHAVTSTECAGAFGGNDIPFPDSPGVNLGYYGDGLVNGAAQTNSGTTIFPNGMFSDLYSPQYLNPNGNHAHPDPGWIYLGQSNGHTFSGATVDNGGADQFAISSSFFSFSVNNTTGTGTWSINEDSADVNAMLNLLGGDIFDQFALVFKAGNSFEAFDFTASTLGLTLSNPPTIYNFAGGFDLSSYFNQPGYGFSSVELYARDPIFGSETNVPEPFSLALMAIGFAGLGVARRRQH
jgi:hypothetical protein